MTVKEILLPFWWFMGMLVCILILELLNSAFTRELDKLFKEWDSRLHDSIPGEQITRLYWNQVDFIKKLMGKSLNIFTFFSALVVLVALMFRSNATGPILSFCLGIITYRFAIFNNWLKLKKFGDAKRSGRNGNEIDL